MKMAFIIRSCILIGPKLKAFSDITAMGYLQVSKTACMPLIKIEGRACREAGLAIRDTLDLLGGKWKVCILQMLSGGPLRFTELLTIIQPINAKVLTKELNELEQHQLIVRNPCNTKPATVQYTLAPHAENIRGVLDALLQFGILHREKIRAGFTIK
ncbi:helix-turn-helix transcriptional regulator [Pseudobacter ginsenosidimutans]|nr:helix-turn-helix transcriptional regulator [Pseudobacter ginsenosidimutans]